MDIVKLKSNLLLLLTSIIWGTTFVAQSIGAEFVGPLAFNAGRGFFAMTFLLAVCLLKPRNREAGKAEAAPRKLLIKGGILCGCLMFVANILQQTGIALTSVGKSGFITALYVVLVPVFGIFLKSGTTLKIWISVALATAGLYLLCAGERITIAPGDLLTLLCAAAFAVYILAVDRFAGRVDVVWLSFVQFATLFVLSSIGAFIFEPTPVELLLRAAVPVIYAGVLSSGIAYTFQMMAQRHTDPTSASLIMSLESVFALLAGMIFLQQYLSGREIIGCVVMFASIILSQLPERRRGVGR